MAPSRRGFLLRDRNWAYLQYGEEAAGGRELFDMVKDPGQFTNLADNASHADITRSFEDRLATKLKAIRTNDLGISYKRSGARKK